MLYRRVLISFVLALLNTCAWAQIPSAYQVGTWKDFKPSALSYTFDDNTSNQIPVAIPLFNNYGFPTTIFAVTQSMNPNWNNMKNAAANGHEIASHTVTHADLSNSSISTQDSELSNSQATINSQITNQKCVTVAYPNCNIGDVNTIQKYYIAGRTCSGQIIPSNPSDFYRLSSIICGNTGVNTTNDMNSRANSARSSGGWCVFLLHGIDNDGGYSPLASSVLSSHLSYVNTNKADYWVATFGGVVKYIKERNALSIAEIQVNADSITITPSDNLDNSIYNVPVTVRREMPSGWTNARVMLGNSVLASTVVTVNNVKYVQFDVIPDNGVYTLANPDQNSCPTPMPQVTAVINYELGETASALTATGTQLKWYTSASGGTGSSTAPVPSTSATGSTTYYVSQTLNDCEGPRAAITVNVTYLFKIHKTPVAPTIDGEEDAVWMSADIETISAEKEVVATVSSPNDLSGTLKLLWDDSNVYFYSVITDDVKQNDSQNSYEDDAIEIYVDVNNDKATEYGTNDVQYSFGWDDGTVVGALPSGRSVAGITYSAVSTANGYIVEGSIPWSTLQSTPSIDQLIGLDFMINDDDDGAGRDGKLSWSAATDDAWQNPSLFGTAILANELSDVITAASDRMDPYFQVFPNPFSKAFKIHKQGNFQVIVMDINGRELLKTSGKDQLEIGASLPKGVYQVTILSESATDTMQVIKR